MPDREENRVLKKLKILVRGMPDKTPDVDVAGLQKNVCMNDASRAATAVFDDLRYGFICTPIGDPLASYGYVFRGIEFGHGKYSDSFCDSPTEGEEAQCQIIASRRDRQLIESRAIVTRVRDAKMPTWGNGLPASIFQPEIWFFDAYSGCENAVLPIWHFPIVGTAEKAMARRNLAEFLSEEYENRCRSYDCSMWPSFYR